MPVVSGPSQFICESLIYALESFVNIDTGRASFEQMGHTGMFDALLSEENFRGYGPEVYHNIAAPRSPHTKRNVIIRYKRMKKEEAYNDLDHCNPTCTSLEPREMTFDMELNKGDCLMFYRQTLISRCPGLGTMFNNRVLNFSPGISGWELPPELVTDFWDMFRALRLAINKSLIQRAASYKSTYILPLIDGVTPPTPYPILMTDSAGDKVWPGGLAELGLRLEDADVKKALVVYGNGPMRKALKVGNYYSTANVDGIDMRRLLEETTGMTNGVPLVPYYDRDFNAIYSPDPEPKGQFIAWKPGALQLHHYVEFADTGGSMRHQGGDWFETCIPDPVHGDKFWYDVSVAYDHCAIPPEGGVKGAWKISIKANYDLFVYPADVYPIDDPMEGVRNVFNFIGTADDKCIPICD